MPNLLDCSTSDGRKNVAIFHTITELKYDAYIANATSPKPRSFTRDEIINAATGGGNPAVYLSFTIAADGSVDFKGSDDPMPVDGIHYTMCLFRGIDAMDSPEEFTFTAAVDMRGNTTVVFKTVIGGQDVRYYDVSSEHP